MPGEQIQIVKGKPVVNSKKAISKFIATETLVNTSGEELLAEKWSESFNFDKHYEIYNTIENGRLDETSLVHCSCWPLLCYG